MKALVTGASGHIAAALIRLLLQEGFGVKAFARSTSNVSAVAPLGIEIATGDVADEESIERAMKGCEVLFHLAAPTRIVTGIETSIIDGTNNVLRIAAKCGIASVVYTSSIVTVGYSDQPSKVLDESSREQSSASSYHRAKFEAEQLALDWAEKGLFKLVVVNPATVVGSLDLRITPSNEVIQRGLDRRLRFSFDSGLTIASVRDVARGHLLAFRQGRCGERYILGGERLLIRDYFRLVQECCGYSQSMLHLPRGALLAIGSGFSLWNMVSGKQVPFTLAQARSLAGKYGFYSSRKAEDELSYTWRPAKDAIMDYVNWARSGRPI